MYSAFDHLSRRMLSVSMPHFNPMFEWCLTDQQGKDINAIGYSNLKPSL